MPTTRADFEALASKLATNNSLAGSLDGLLQFWIDEVARLAAQPRVTAAELQALGQMAEDTRAKIAAAVVKGTPAATVPDNPPPAETPPA